MIEESKIASIPNQIYSSSDAILSNEESKGNSRVFSELKHSMLPAKSNVRMVGELINGFMK